MASQLVQDLIESGIHFGQRSAGWNPKMSQFIWGKRNGIHIIDIKETIKGLLLAKKFLSRVVSDGKDVCFVGTKRQARDVLQQRVGDVKMHWVTERWLGGTLTNFRTIRSRLRRMEELEAIETSTGFANYSKKMESQLKRELKKIKRNLEGIRGMDKLPGALVIIDVRRELNALKEAKKLGIPTVCLIDTDGDPDLADIAIPGNDDSMRSIDVIIRELCLAIAEGKQTRADSKANVSGGPNNNSGVDMTAGGQLSADGKGESRAPKGRSSRSQFRADDKTAEPAAEVAKA